jgi:hypothetical protein
MSVLTSVQSAFLKLGKNDLIKGAIMTAGTAVATALLPMLQSGKMPDLNTVQVAITAGITTGIVYLLKNIFTNSQGMLGKEPVPPAK